MEATSRRSVTSSAHFKSAGELGQTAAFIPDILCAMSTVSHFLHYGKDGKAGRELFRDVLGFGSIDVGEGWSIFAVPPAEAGIHRRDGEFSQQPAGHRRMRAVLYLMGEERDAQIEFLKCRNVHGTGMEPAPWGRAATSPSPIRWPRRSLPAVVCDGFNLN